MLCHLLSQAYGTHDCHLMLRIIMRGSNIIVCSSNIFMFSGYIIMYSSNIKLFST